MWKFLFENWSSCDEKSEKKIIFFCWIIELSLYSFTGFINWDNFRKANVWNLIPKEKCE